MKNGAWLHTSNKKHWQIRQGIGSDELSKESNGNKLLIGHATKAGPESNHFIG